MEENKYLFVIAYGCCALEMGTYCSSALRRGLVGWAHRHPGFWVLLLKGTHGSKWGMEFGLPHITPVGLILWTSPNHSKCPSQFCISKSKWQQCSGKEREATAPITATVVIKGDLLIERDQLRASKYAKSGADAAPNPYWKLYELKDSCHIISYLLHVVNPLD